MRSIIDDFTAKDVFGHVIVSFSGGRQVLLGVEDKLVSISTQENGDLLADHSKGEHIAILLLTVLQELNRVATNCTRLNRLKWQCLPCVHLHAKLDSIAHEGNP